MPRSNIKLSSITTAKLVLPVLGLVILASFLYSLFVPMMDSDASHHANIALRMMLTGDYISLIDRGEPYLDKPHLLFWTSALSMNLFGINAFGYKLPSFLFTLLGIFSTFRLATRLYDKKIGWISVIVLTTVFSFVLANSDVRMDAMLTAFIIFTAWQFYEFYHSRSLTNLLGVSLGLALGFMTKGMIGPAVPTFAFFFYLLEKKDLRIFLDYKLYLIIPLFLLFSSPVLYAYFLQFDLHPELVIRGRENISGVKFILWDQNFERFDGEIWGADGGKDYFFFLHTILWAFLPWPLLFYFGFIKGFTSKIKKQNQIEWMTLGTISFLLLIYSFAGFKLPHYLNTLIPFMSILTAASMVKFNVGKIMRHSHLLLISLVLILVLILNTYFFPMDIFVLIGICILTGGLGYLLWQLKDKLYKMILTTAAIGAIINLIMHANFYPQILTYQGGSALAESVEEKGIPNDNIHYFEMHSFSFDFRTAYLHPTVDMEMINAQLMLQDEIFLYVNEDGKATLDKTLDIKTEVIAEKAAFHVSRLKFKFINPATRENALNQNYVIRVTKNQAD